MFERHARDHGRQPSAEVLHLARVGAAQAEPRVLNGVVRLGQRAEHPVGHRAQVRAVVVEFPGEKFLVLIHVTFLGRGCRGNRPAGSDGCDQIGLSGSDPRTAKGATDASSRCRSERRTWASALVPPADRCRPRGGRYATPRRRAPSACARAGAEPVMVDLLDAGAVPQGGPRAAPDAIVHQATALADAKFGAQPRQDVRVRPTGCRTEGTDALLAAAREAGVDRFVGQSFALATGTRTREVRSRPRPTRSTPTRRRCARETYDAMNHLDRVVTEFGGIALRYGGFYGDANDALGRAGAPAAIPDHRRRRRDHVLHPPRRCRRRDRARARPRGSRRSTTSSTTSRLRCASGCRSSHEALGAKPPRHFPRLADQARSPARPRS